MPYIKQERRDEFDNGNAEAEKAGELNYMITTECLNYLNKHGKSYMVINDIVGALECAKLEFYRRLVAPYEDTKIAENGDVY